MASKNKGTLRKTYRISMLCALIPLAACQSVSPTISIAEDYLEAIQAGNTEAIADLTCLKDPNSREELTPGIKSWNFIDESIETSDSDPLGTYTSVLAKIRYEGIASPVENLFEVIVWETEGLYQYQLRRTEELNQMYERSEALVERIDVMLGDETDSPDTENSSSEAPSRDDLTSEEHCVTQLRQAQP